MTTIDKGSKYAKSVASYLVNKHNCSFSNTFDGNMKLQKMLVNANLIHIVRNRSLLFEDEMYAFKNGIVVESVRKPFQTEYTDFNQELKEHQEELTDEEKRSIDLSFEIFYPLSASELSDLHHELDTWKNCYDRSLMGEEYRHKPLALIKDRDLVQDDLQRLSSVIASFEEKDDELESEVVNDVTFYYDPQKIEINDQILAYLEDVSTSVKGEDSAYYLATDENLGVYYY